MCRKRDGEYWYSCICIFNIEIFTKNIMQLFNCLTGVSIFLLARTGVQQMRALSLLLPLSSDLDIDLDLRSDAQS
jgi:hypothetical protein